MIKAQILAVLMLVLSLNTFADSDMNVICERPGIDTQNQFDLVGVVTKNDDNSYDNAIFSLTLRPMGKDQAETQGIVESSGTVKVFPAGTMGHEEVIHLQHVNKGANIEYISIVGNHPGPLSSSIRFSDGTTFKSQCYVR